MASRRAGFVVVLSGASGTGKTTVRERVLARLPALELSISYTTRRRRHNEVQHSDYHFITRKRYDRMVHDGEFVEHAEVFGHGYGTAVAELERLNRSGKDALLEIDQQGGLQVKQRMPESVLIFLLPPSLDGLRKRLRSRGTEDLVTLARRLSDARQEIEAAETSYDYFVTNDQLERAVDDVVAIIRAERCKRDRRRPDVRRLLLERW